MGKRHKRSTAYRAKKRTHKLKQLIKRQIEQEEKREARYGSTSKVAVG